MDNCRSILRRVALATMAVALAAAAFPAHAQVKSVVLVHGAFADGSGWKSVADILQSHGYSVRVVQQPETSFAADVAATRRVLDKAGPCVLVGHSYGGMIITETGTHPDVKALVYVAAMQEGRSPPIADFINGTDPFRTCRALGNSSAPQVCQLCNNWIEFR